MIMKKTIKEFSSFEEFRKYAEAEGIDLTDIELRNAKGGVQENDSAEPDGKKCPSCGSRNTHLLYYVLSVGAAVYECRNCGHIWWEFVD